MCISLANQKLQLLLTWPLESRWLATASCSYLDAMCFPYSQVEKCFTVQLVVSSFCVCMHVLATTFRSTLMEPCFTILCLCTPQEGAKKLCWGIEFFAQTLVLLYYKLSTCNPSENEVYQAEKIFADKWNTMFLSMFFEGHQKYDAPRPHFCFIHISNDLHSTRRELERSTFSLRSLLVNT